MVENLPGTHKDPVQYLAKEERKLRHQLQLVLPFDFSSPPPPRLVLGPPGTSEKQL